MYSKKEKKNDIKIANKELFHFRVYKITYSFRAIFSCKFAYTFLFFWQMINFLT